MMLAIRDMRQLEGLKCVTTDYPITICGQCNLGQVKFSLSRNERLQQEFYRSVYRMFTVQYFSDTGGYRSAICVGL